MWACSYLFEMLILIFWINLLILLDKYPMRYHLIHVRMTVIKKTQQVLVRIRNFNFCALLVGMQNGAGAVENSLAVPEKIKNSTTI